jgi:hypothetical protein
VFNGKLPSRAGYEHGRRRTPGMGRALREPGGKLRAAGRRGSLRRTSIQTATSASLLLGIVRSCVGSRIAGPPLSEISESRCDCEPLAGRNPWPAGAPPRTRGGGPSQLRAPNTPKPGTAYDNGRFQAIPGHHRRFSAVGQARGGRLPGLPFGRYVPACPITALGRRGWGEPALVCLTRQISTLAVRRMCLLETAAWGAFRLFLVRP